MFVPCTTIASIWQMSQCTSLTEGVIPGSTIAVCGSGRLCIQTPCFHCHATFVCGRIRALRVLAMLREWT